MVYPLLVPFPMRNLARATVTPLLLVALLATPAAAVKSTTVVKKALNAPRSLSGAIVNKSARLLRRHGSSLEASVVDGEGGAPKPSLADRLTEKVANFTGTGKFLALQGAITAGWIAGANWLGDPEMFKLNLSISITTMLATTVVAIAQRRADKRDRLRAAEDRARAEEDLEVDKASAKEILTLRAETAELRSELKAMGDRSSAEKHELLEQLKVMGDQLRFLTDAHKAAPRAGQLAAK
jgi:uncharacterized membrane protein